MEHFDAIWPQCLALLCHASRLRVPLKMAPLSSFSSIKFKAQFIVSIKQIHTVSQTTVSDSASATTTTASGKAVPFDWHTVSF